MARGEDDDETPSLLPVIGPHGRFLMRLPTPGPKGGRPASTARRIAVELEGRELHFVVPDADRADVRQFFQKVARVSRRRAAEAAIRIKTAYAAVGFGAALFSGGIVALATASGTIGVAGMAVTGAGAILAGSGALVGHRTAYRRLTHVDAADTYADIAEELR